MVVSTVFCRCALMHSVNLSVCLLQELRVLRVRQVEVSVDSSRTFTEQKREISEVKDLHVHVLHIMWHMRC